MQLCEQERKKAKKKTHRQVPRDRRLMSQGTEQRKQKNDTWQTKEVQTAIKYK